MKKKLYQKNQLLISFPKWLVIFVVGSFKKEREGWWEDRWEGGREGAREESKEGVRREDESREAKSRRNTILENGTIRKGS